MDITPSPLSSTAKTSAAAAQRPKRRTSVHNNLFKRSLFKPWFRNATTGAKHGITGRAFDALGDIGLSCLEIIAERAKREISRSRRGGSSVTIKPAHVIHACNTLGISADITGDAIKMAQASSYVSL